MIKVSFDKDAYSINAVKKCLYWYTEEFAVELKQNDKQITIELDPLDSKNNYKKDKVIKKLKNDLMDFEVRNIVTKETKNVRDLLIAKAFSSTDEYESEPPGEISDPVGFKP